MAEAQANPIKVLIAPDKSQVELLFPVGYQVDATTAALCQTLLGEAGVEQTKDVLKAVKELLAQPVDPQVARQGVVARATPALEGQDGKVDWLVDHLPQDADATVALTDERNGAQSYYEQSAFIMVEEGQVVAQFSEPVAGSDGRDVCGGTIVCKPARPAAWEWDETLSKDREGRLVARTQGVLYRKDGKAAVRHVIEIDDCVDFSTGNISFTGDVVVHKSVRDCFEIQVDGSVTVHGLIEAAHIKCGQDLHALGGMAGREEGTVRVGGRLDGKYLDNVRGEITGDLAIEREVINCFFTIEGNIDMPHGAIIGGRQVVIGKVHLGTLGSPASVRSELVVGTIPALEPLLARLEDLLDEIEREHNILFDEQQILQKEAKRLTASAKERQTELMFELASLQTARRKAEGALAALRDYLEANRVVDVTIERELHAGSVLVVHDVQFHLTQDLKGPLRIVRKEGEIRVERHGRLTVLNQFASVGTAQAA